MRLSVIGLGKLGAPLAAVLAGKGFRVAAVDCHAETVASLRARRAPVSEPGLQELLSALPPERLEATTDLAAAVLNSEATFVVVPTPSRSDGTYSEDTVTAAVREIGSTLRQKQTRHLVVIASTIMPGTMQGAIREALESSSGLRLGGQLGLCYSPEFIALGRVIQDLRQPDFILIGESDSRSGDELEEICRARCDNLPRVRRMSFANAELTKIVVNAMITTKISYANMLSEICERLPGADAAVVAAAAGSDHRIGASYLAPALGYGGPCFPRDNVALTALAHTLGTGAELAEATDRINRRQAARVVSLVRDLLPLTATATVGVLGLAYKPDTCVTEESQGLAIARLLAEAGYRVLASDPEAVTAAGIGPGAERVAPADCVRRSDLLIVATPWDSFRDLPPSVFRRADRRLPVIDCWRLLPPELTEAVDTLYLGQFRQARSPRKEPV